MVIDLEELKNINEDLVYLGDKPEQYQDAIVGITYDNNHVIYDVDRFINLMMVQDGMTYEEAEDWVSYNTQRSIEYICGMSVIQSLCIVKKRKYI